MTALHLLPATELVRRIAAGALCPVDVADHYLDRAARIDPVLKSFVTLDPDDVRRQAIEARRRIRDQELLGPLHGLPISVKDLIPTEGLRTTRGSLLFEHDV